MKRRRYLVMHGVRWDPLSLQAQEKWENDDRWEVEHVFEPGVWVVRTGMDGGLLVHEFVNLLTNDGGASVIAVRTTKKNLWTNGLWPKQVRLLKGLIVE